MLDCDALLIDLKGAARIGSPEALDLALEGLAAWKAFTANARLASEDVARVLVPLGEVLAAPTVPAAYLRSLAEHPLAGGRALAAVALTLRYLRGEAAWSALLTRLAGDRRAEVRFALATSLGQHGRDEHFPAAAALLKAWLDPARGPRAGQTALQAAAVLAQPYPRQVLSLLARLTPAQVVHPEVQRPLAEALKQVGAFGTDEDKTALAQLLARWLQESGGEAARLVLQVLHAGWARQAPEQTLALLDAVEATGGASRLSRRTRAFIRRAAGMESER